MLRRVRALAQKAASFRKTQTLRARITVRDERGTIDVTASAPQVCAFELSTTYEYPKSM